jgi:endonuclease/exonuclease/phosphatase (EEP) superfamily protein YafD
VTSSKERLIPPSERALDGRADDSLSDGVAVAVPARREAAVGRRLLVVSTFALCVCAAVLAAGRLAHLDDAIAWPYTLINAFTQLVYLPAYAALAVAFAYRRYLLLVLPVLVVAAHLAWTVPEIVPGHAETAPAGAAPVRLMTANLYFENGTAGRLGAQIRAENPDVVVLEEVSKLTLSGVLSSGALDGYPHREADERVGAFGSAVFSRFPLRDADVPFVAGLPSLRLTVDVDAKRSFRLFAVHTLAPVNAEYADRWRAQFDFLNSQARAADLPVVLAGDFNATRDHRPFRRLADAGLRDAHDAAGAGWAPTWNAHGLLPRLLRIDHVMVSDEFAVTGHRVGDAFGGDHVPVTVDLALR